MSYYKFSQKNTKNNSTVACQSTESYVVSTQKNCLNEPVSQFILPPGQLAPWGASQPRLAYPRGASCPGISCPPPWLSSPPGGKLSRPVYLVPRPTQAKIYTCYFVIFLYHFNEFRSSISRKVRNWCLWG